MDEHGLVPVWSGIPQDEAGQYKPEFIAAMNGLPRSAWDTWIAASQMALAALKAVAGHDAAQSFPVDVTVMLSYEWEGRVYNSMAVVKGNELRETTIE